MVVIVGAGASGLFLATLLKRDYILLDMGDIGRKIRVSGGGKCNITNKIVTPKNYRGDSGFVKKALSSFDNNDLLKWLKRNNLAVFEKKKNQYFFNSSSVLLDFFKRRVKLTKAKVLDIDGDVVITDRGKFSGEKIVIATGGISYKKLGVSRFGLDFAKKIGHKVEEFKPALVGLTVQKEQFWFKNLSGVGFIADVKVGDKKFTQNILFSHRGITGPAILNASLWWERGKIEIDFLRRDVKKLLKDKNKQISTQLPLPKRFTKEFLKSINLEDKRVRFLKSEEWKRLKLLNSYSFAPAGTFGFDKAEVSKGGVEVDEIDEFMRSKIDKRYYFIGEVLNITGELGGYNFQWAFTSAFNAYKSVCDL